MCGEAEQVMHNVTKISRENSEYVELGSYQCNWDFDDLKMYQRLETSNLFDVSNQRLWPLSTGIAAKETDNIHCDTAEEVDEETQKIMDKNQYYQLKFQKIEG